MLNKLAFWQKLLALLVVAFSVGGGLIAFGWNASGVFEDTVDLTTQLGEINSGIEDLDFALGEVVDSIASAQETVELNGQHLAEVDRRLQLTEEAQCSPSELEHNGLERRIDCAAMQRLKELSQ